MKVDNLTKCGEIFTTANGEFNFLCYLCSDLFDKVVDFECHQIQTHFLDKQTKAITPVLNSVVVKNEEATAVESEFENNDEDVDSVEDNDNFDDFLELENSTDNDNHPDEPTKPITPSSTTSTIIKPVEEIDNNNKQSFVCMGLQEQHQDAQSNITKKKPYKCCDCLARFSTTNELNGHQKLHTTHRELAIKCKYCKKTLKITELNKHIFKNEDNKETNNTFESVNINCPICKLKLRPASMLRHVNKHLPINNIFKYSDFRASGEGSFMMRCPLCQIFVHLSTLHNHFKKFHSSLYDDTVQKTKQFKLNIGGKSKLLTDPSNISMNKYLDIACPLCKKSLRLSTIFDHIKLHKNDINCKTKCGICSLEINIDSLFQHLLSKHKIDEDCSITSGDIKSLFLIMCPICKNPRSPDQLRQHIYKQHADHVKKSNPQSINELLKINCQICGKLLSAASMIDHIYSIHKIDNKIKCMECGEIVYYTNFEKHQHYKPSIKKMIKKPTVENSIEGTKMVDETKVVEETKILISLPTNLANITSNKYLEIPCPICQELLRLSSITNHIQNHKAHLNYSPDAYQSKCTICSEEINIDLFYHHLLTQHKIDEDGSMTSNDIKSLFLIACPICNYIDSTDHLKQHISKQHFDQIKHLNAEQIEELLNTNCQICGQLLCASLIINHLYDTHNITNKIKCPECNEIIYYSTFEQHQQVHHETPINNNIDKTMICDICNEHVYSRHSLMEHFRWHKNKCPPRSCRICHKYFKHSSSQRTHMRVMHTNLRPYQCEICGKSYAFAYQLNPHIKQHKFPKKPCPICKKMLTSTALRNHIKAHSSERPYKCKLCDKSFKYTKILNTHMKIHSIEKQHKCKYCDMEFSQTAGRRCHEKRVHNMI